MKNKFIGRVVLIGNEYFRDNSDQSAHIFITEINPPKKQFKNDNFVIKGIDIKGRQVEHFRTKSWMYKNITVLEHGHHLEKEFIRAILK